MEKWFVAMKKADFNGIAEKYQISPIIARLMRNRDVVGDDAIDFYLNGTVENLYDGLLMKDMDRAVDILKEKIEEGTYDAACILYEYFNESYDAFHGFCYAFYECGKCRACVRSIK